MKSKILLILILIIQQLIVPISGKTQGDLCNLVGFSTQVFFNNPVATLDVNAVSISPPIPMHIDLLPGTATTSITTNSLISPTNTSAYNPATGDLICMIAEESKMLYYEAAIQMHSTVQLPHRLTAPVFLNGKIYAIDITDNTAGNPFKFDLYAVQPTGNVHLAGQFVSPYPLQGTFSRNLISSATNGADEIYIVSGINLIVINSLQTIPNAFFTKLHISHHRNFLGVEYRNPGSLLLIENGNFNLDIVMADWNISGGTLNSLLSSVYPLSNLSQSPGGWIINDDFYSTAYDNCNGKYYINTYHDPMFSTSRLFTYDITSATIEEEILDNYLFGIEIQPEKCCQSYPCEARVDQIEGKEGEFGISIDVDQDGFIYTTGGFTNEAIFPTVHLITQGQQDIFVSKHDQNANFIHAIQLGNSGVDEGRGIAVAPSGNIYISGFFTDPISGFTGAIVAKLDNSLSLIWQKVFYSINGNVVGNAIALDEDENIYFTGHFIGMVQFDGISFTSYGGSADVYITSLNGATGSVNWAKQLGGDGFDEGKGIALDPQGYVSVVGDFEYSIFVPSGSIALSSYGGRDVFLTKHDHNGTFDWITNLGGSNDEAGNTIAVDQAGDIYITGDFEYDAQMNGFSFITLAPGGLFDTYVSKHRGTDGSVDWTAQLRGNNSGTKGKGWSVALNKTGSRVYTSGIFNGLTDFDPSSDNYYLNPTGDEMFVSRLDASDGSYLNAFRFGPTIGTSGGFPERAKNAIALDKSGCVNTTGTFFGTVDFNPPPGSIPVLPLTASEFYDAFVHKFCCCCDDEENFHDLINMGWQVSIDETNCEVTVTASQFSDCHSMTSMAPDWGDGSIGLPAFGPANGTWTHTYNDSGTYDICAWIVEMHNGVECWWAQICVQVEIECCPDSTSVSIPHSIVCTTDPSFTIPINCPTNCIVDQVEWFVKDVNATSFPTTPYQSILGPNCAGLTILPGQFSNLQGLHVYAVIYFDLASCCGITQFTTNIATVKLCSPRFCTITNPHPEGFCEYGVPDPLIINFTGQSCGNSTVEWFYNGSLVSNSSQQYQPPPLEFVPGGPSDCYTEHKFIVRLTGVCGINTCETSIFVYNPNSPLGVLEMNPDEDQPFCYGEDATLKYDHACSGISPEWWIPKWTWHSTTIDPPAITDYQIIPGAGTSNPVYNTNQLFETTWFMIEKQNGVCPEQHIQYKIEVLEPLVINSFQAVTNPCAENLVNLSVDFSPSPLPLPQNADVHWYVNGDLIGTSIASTSPVHYPFYYPGNIAGVYYAEILEYYCNQTIETPPVIIEPSCTPVVSGPCYRCFEDINPIELTGDMVVPPGLPCPDISNCSFQWYEIDNTGNLIPIPGATGLTHFSPHAATFVLFSDCNGCQKWSSPHTVIQCDQVLSVEDEPKGFLTVNIYPNPTMNEVNINVMPAPNRNSTVTISDINGKILKSAVLPANTENIRIELNDIRAGFYLVHIYEDQRLVWIDKIIIIK